MARLFGMQPAPVRQCRVLEIGCGDGMNLIPMAVELPDSFFAGIDLSSAAVAEANEIINEAGLRNICIVEKNILGIGSEFQQFDYIIAHGVYSWVPQPVRDALLAVCRSKLKPDGVAYISYNTNPGFHARAPLRDLLLFHLQSFTAPTERLKQARSFLEFLKDAGPIGESFDTYLKDEALSALRRDPEGMYHDDLGEVNDPVYFSEFADHVARHDLQYLSDVSFSTMIDPNDLLGDITDDLIRKEQYLDFLRMRRFRQSLLCHKEVALDRELSPDAVTQFYVSSQATEAHCEGVEVEFREPSGASARTADAVAIAMFRYLGECWPRPISYKELHEEVGEDVSELLFGCFAGGTINLHSHDFAFAEDPGEFPVTSPVVRVMARRGGLLPNLVHQAVEVDDEAVRKLLISLDGTRRRTAALDQALHVLGKMALFTE
jgi:SAM-dependent methyltransferase